MVCVAFPDPQPKPPRPGLKQGALWCARGSISDFATVVPKSYSNSLSLVSTLVQKERISYSASGLGTARYPKGPVFAGRNLTRRHADDDYARRSTT
jgi:hypothetical protein